MAANMSSLIDDVLETDIFEELNLSEVAVLGVGAYGKVVLAVSKDDPNEKLALKMFSLSEDAADEDARKVDEETKRMFCKEVQVMKGLHHCSIMPLLYSVQAPDCLALVMPACERGAVADAITTLLPSQQLKYIRQLCQAIHYLHEKNTVHLDIKANNILIDDDDNILLSDFGFSRVLPNKHVEIFVELGTEYYRAPETYSDERVNPFKVDMYAFGMTCWTIVMKTRPSKVDFLDIIRNSLGVPYIYRRMVTFLMQAVPDHRPSAAQVLEIVCKL
ncbi:cell cycle serine/threonine-protein kinase CDC5/MSD2 [Biomphalaria glabrata]|nr:cell cycle serine/threonine-protein kinase CDC5/MSD2 [Biomphalaria glabrata]